MSINASSIRLPSDRGDSFDQLVAVRDRASPDLTMFSGGLDSTYLLFKLQELGFGNISAIAVNVGDQINQSQMKQMAAKFGARFTYLDGRKAFVELGVKPAERAHEKYLGNYPLSSSLSRPIIARMIADHVSAIGSVLLLHTANLSQNSLSGLNNSIERHGFSGFFGNSYVRSIVSRRQKGFGGRESWSYLDDGSHDEWK